MFSESLSDARRSLKSSTDDLLLPRVSTSDQREADESSHWHSVPLGLALLPAVGGMVFTNGSAVITDITLLGLAAVFMNWSLRIPWDWYKGAQSLSVEPPTSPSTFTPIEEEDESQLTENSPNPGESKGKDPRMTSSVTAAQQELRLHEMLALLTCFGAPLVAAWLLHTIRSQLSRPSEGLVSDYNLSIFLLVAEIRPLSHMIKMIQRRTLFLQRRINSESLQDQMGTDGPGVSDLVSRIEELEADVAHRIEASEARPKESPESMIAIASTHASSDVRRTVQPELDALGRAMRRYEKRTTISAVQFEARLQELEASLKDVVILAAAAQRSSEQQPTNYVHILFNWLCALVVVPIQALQSVLMLPPKLFLKVLAMLSKYLPLPKPKKGREGKPGRRAAKGASQERERRLKGPG